MVDKNVGELWRKTKQPDLIHDCGWTNDVRQLIRKLVLDRMNSRYIHESYNNAEQFALRDFGIDPSTFNENTTQL